MSKVVEYKLDVDSITNEGLIEKKESKILEYRNERTIEKYTYKSLYIYYFIKRTMDILFSIIGMVVLLPMILVVYILNKLNKENGPVFYSHYRIGKNGDLFKMYKFRTMVTNADEILEEMLKDKQVKKEYDVHKKLENDPRITKIGKFLRNTSIDEFPQFINVFKGDMTIVGPRPYLPREIEDMGKTYNDIIRCKPGLTGPWQTSGRSNATFKDRLKLDVEYAKNRHTLKDIKLLLKTFTKLIQKEGAM